ncbi:MAG: hypothetical protein A2Z34_01940 [Planctomycetes bacterium RBG_16_59_8]|nr:MAG: hypothetical protein A2Z34_01940 [Planctomycetes bacterium RBG_16_59_8]
MPESNFRSVGYRRRRDLLAFGILFPFVVAAIPVILAFYPSWYNHGGYFWRVVVWYGIAKLLDISMRRFFRRTAS